ncbi:MAG: hypothetical protein EU981_02380 [Candidatus Liberibacter ctenarytainae]|uniref:Uncharacterized protein n=1 Tax=Candidatus Liberibacter ctenarytainae TaxID=2020335 RepID=A0A937AJP3_9HYPH|nr:hypothetical protein [Candidatus Liberibacter ctenarytainae]
MLNFDHKWNFNSPGKIPDPIVDEFSAIITKISQGQQYRIERFKHYFAQASGDISSPSTKIDWAHTDLEKHMNDASVNAPLFIAAFYNACKELEKDPNIPLPTVFDINNILAKHHANYRINPPNLVALDSIYTPAPPKIPASLDQQARERIQNSMSKSQQLMSEGMHRQAVQEALWLLESVSTAFQGIKNGENSITAKYFNKIMEVLKRNNKGTALK